MKSYLYIAAILSTALLPACSGEGETPLPTEGRIEIYAGLPGIDTRVSGAYWESGDKIGIFCTPFSTDGGTYTANNLPYVLDGDAGIRYGKFVYSGNNAALQPDQASSYYMTAFYPFSGNEGDMNITETIDTRTQGNVKDYLGARKRVWGDDRHVGFNFSHLMSKLTVSIETSSDQMSIADAVCRISGFCHDGVFRIDKDSEPGVTVTGNAVNDWVFSMKTPDSQSSVKKVYSLMLLPQTVSSDLTLTVSGVKVGDVSSEHSARFRINLEKGMEQTLNVRIVPGALEIVQSQIKNWITEANLSTTI